MSKKAKEIAQKRVKRFVSRLNKDEAESLHQMVVKSFHDPTATDNQARLLGAGKHLCMVIAGNVMDEEEKRLAIIQIRKTVHALLPHCANDRK